MDANVIDLTETTPPPVKRRRVISVRPTPPRLSDLLTAFGAQKTPGSVTKMERRQSGREMRLKSTVNYAESEDSTPQASPQSSFGEESQSSRTSVLLDSKEESESEDELQSDGVGQVAARPVGTRELPARSTRTQVSYASPVKPKKSAKRGKSKRLLVSDMKKQKRGLATETERTKVRNTILEHTKPKRDAFILAHKEYFLPLLPETSYVDKLQRANDIMGTGDPNIVDYQALESQPRGVTAVMKPYQLDGLSFLLHMYRNGMSAILGDEMGLGKTLQTLSLFQYLAENEQTGGEERPFLVVCPLSVLSSWLNEARKWTPNIDVIRFHGPKAEREKLKKELLESHNLVAKKSTKKSAFLLVTTYETFTAEQSWFKRAFAWRYCVLDEGHKIKNDKSDVASGLQSLQAEYRLLLTGTPLQNNLMELWALLHWLFPDVFPENTSEGFKQAFDLTRGRVSTSFMDDARRLLELLMLRRMKVSPGVNLDLPPKTEILLYVPLTPMQRFWYTRILTKADNALLDDLYKDAKVKVQDTTMDDQELSLLEKGATAADILDVGVPATDAWAESKQILEQAAQNTGAKDSEWRKLLNLVMQLRKVCSHPYLLPHAQPDPYYLGDHVKTASGKFIVLDKLVEELVLKRRKKILIFSGFTNTLNLCEDLLALKGGNAHNPAFRYVRFDGSTARAQRNLGIRMFNDSTSNYQVMLISTRAGGLGVNLASASDVIFLDEDWNPQVTLQAEARAHRIGQNQKVTVYKICTQGTVEEQMMGRIRKKLYLSAKITESMRNIHSAEAHGVGQKRKRVSEVDRQEDEPQLGTSQLKTLLRKGAETLARPEVDVTAMLAWSFDTMIEQCKEKEVVVESGQMAESDPAAVSDTDEQTWLNTMEKVECAVFEGKRHQRQSEQKMKEDAELSRADRRVGKNTTVMIDGFAINKESLQCADWEAVPTMAGKDPRLAEPVRAKKQGIINQDYCQHCFDGGDVVLCSGCPRTYHIKCLSPEFKAKAKSHMQFHCPQHECVDCQAKTGEAGGMIYRCRWCENGYCEDCLDFETATLIGDTLPEYEMLGFGPRAQAWYIDCPACVKHWETSPEDREIIEKEKERIEKKYAKFVAKIGVS